MRAEKKENLLRNLINTRPADPMLGTHCSSVSPKEGVTSPVVDLIKKLTGVFEHPKELVTIVCRADSRVDCVFFGTAEDGPMYSDACVRE
jgi:hypothetical protein